MSSLNRVELIGRVGRDPEIVHFSNGGSVAKFSIATSEKWKNKDGEQQEETHWHNVEVFGKLADVVNSYVTKGKQIYVSGQVVYDKWEDKDGNNRTSTKIKVDSFNGKIILLGSKGGGQAPAQTQAAVDASEDVPF